jgi:hypothetical protein
MTGMQRCIPKKGGQTEPLHILVTDGNRKKINQTDLGVRFLAAGERIEGSGWTGSLWSIRCPVGHEADPQLVRPQH